VCIAPVRGRAGEEGLTLVGAAVGVGVGKAVGAAVGRSVGAAVGEAVGESVGAAVGGCRQPQDVRSRHGDCQLSVGGKGGLGTYRRRSCRRGGGREVGGRRRGFLGG
jgi:hypothetical protein